MSDGGGSFKEEEFPSPVHSSGSTTPECSTTNMEEPVQELTMEEVSCKRLFRAGCLLAF